MTTHAVAQQKITKTGRATIEHMVTYSTACGRAAKGLRYTTFIAAIECDDCIHALASRVQGRA